MQTVAKSSGTRKVKNEKLSIDEIIRRAVEAGRADSRREPHDAFKATEQRLYAYPVLLRRIENSREQISEIEEFGLREHSGSIMRHGRGSVRLSEEEIAGARRADLERRILMDEREIKTIDSALDIIGEDFYADIVRFKYFEGKNDDEIGVGLNCDASTVRRNKSRLIRRLAVFLYGVAAVA